MLSPERNLRPMETYLREPLPPFFSTQSRQIRKKSEITRFRHSRESGNPGIPSLARVTALEILYMDVNPALGDTQLFNDLCIIGAGANQDRGQFIMLPP